MVDNARSSVRSKGSPLAPLVLAAAGGIVLDRYRFLSDSWIWVDLAIGFSIAAALFGPWSTWLNRVCVLGAFVALGGAWHHSAWFDLAPDDAANGDWSTPKPAWARGVVAEIAVFRAGGGAAGKGITRTFLELTHLNDGTRWHPISGLIQLVMVGDRSKLHAGDRVTAIGVMSAIPAPANPGEYDERSAMQARGVRLRLFTESLTSVEIDREPIDTSTPFGMRSLRWESARILGLVRTWSNARLRAGLSEQSAPLAAALLLGRRDGVDPEVNDAFARTSTTHLLAISGLHMQVLAYAVLVICRGLGMGPRRSARIVALLTVAYSLLVGLAPSVVRSAAMTIAACLAIDRNRSVRPANVLALAAFATLALNPSYLFDVGSQLSFLAVGAILWISGPISKHLDNMVDPLDRLERDLESPWKTRMRIFLKMLRDSVLISLIVWLVGLPLAALRFHMAAPIGVLLNLPLIPLTSLALLAAGLTLVISVVWTPLGWPVARLCDALMNLTEAIVRWGSRQSWGHAFIPGPPPAWAIGFYAILAMVLWQTRKRGLGWPKWCGWACLGAWSAAGIVLTLCPIRPSELQVEVLSVGHGLSIIIQDVSGHAIVYDCGKMRDPGIARRVIAPALWSRRIRRIDTIILSHADADHFNGLPDLVDRFSIGQVLVPPEFGGPANPDANRLIELLKARHIPVRSIHKPQTIAPAAGARIEILHPPAVWPLKVPDNARSVVAYVSSHKRAFLLTGDLEEPGLSLLMEQPSPRAEVLLSPHHGGRKSNTTRFLAWANPRSIVVSQRPPIPHAFDALQQPEANRMPVWRTWNEGAIDLNFRRNEIHITGYLADHEQRTSASQVLSYVNAHWNLSTRRGLLFLIGLGVGGACCYLMMVVEWGGWSLVAPRRRGGANTVATIPLGWSECKAIATDGVRLSGLFRKAEDTHLGLVVLLHGFAEDRSVMIPTAESLTLSGWDVLVIDQRGHGASGGDLVSFGGRETDDLRSWIDHVITIRDVASEPIVLWGRSMGSAVSVRLATSDPRIKALVLEAPYLDLLNAVGGWLARLRVPRFLAPLVLSRAERLAGVSLRYPRPIDLAGRVRVPVLIAHGANDRVVPLVEAQRLGSAFAGTTVVIDVPNAQHVDVLQVGGAQALERICIFLEQIGAGSGECVDASEIPDQAIDERRGMC